jgi:hypothetical protein
MPEKKFGLNISKSKNAKAGIKKINILKNTSKKIILIASLVITIAWLIIAIVLVFIGKRDSFNCNSTLITFTKIAAISAMLGLISYMSSPSIKKVVRANLRKIPILWHKLIDSGYTEYYKPVISQIVDGVYQQLVDTNIMIDIYGLPIVNKSHPLDSFDMNIYLRYFPDTIALFDRIITDSVADNAKDLEAAMKTKYDRGEVSMYAEDIIVHFYDAWRDVMRICGMGNRIIITSNYLGEYLPVHKSEYKTFIIDFYKTVDTLPMDPNVQKDMALQRSIILEDINNIVSLKYSSTQNVNIVHYEMIPVISELRELAQLTDADSFGDIVRKILIGPVNELDFFEQNVKTEDANIIDNAVITNISGHMLDFAIKSFKHNQNTIIGYYSETIDIKPAFAFNEFITVANSNNAHSLYRYINNGNSIAFKELNNIIKNIKEKLEDPEFNEKIHMMFKNLGSANEKINKIKKIVDKPLKKLIDFHNKKILESSFNKSFSLIQSLSYIINPSNKNDISSRLTFPKSPLLETVIIDYDNIPKEKRLFNLERQLETLTKKSQDAPSETQREIKKQITNTKNKIGKINKLKDINTLLNEKEQDMMDTKNKILNITRNEIPLDEPIQTHLAMVKTEMDSLMQTKHELEAAIIDVDIKSSPLTADLATSTLSVIGPQIADIPIEHEVSIDIENEEELIKAEEVINYEKEKLSLEINKQGKQIADILNMFDIMSENNEKSKSQLIEENAKLIQTNEDIKTTESDIITANKEIQEFKQEIQRVQDELLNQIAQGNIIAESERNALVDEIVKSRDELEIVKLKLQQNQQETVERMQKEYEDQLVSMQKTINEKNEGINKSSMQMQILQDEINTINTSMATGAQTIQHIIQNQDRMKDSVIAQLQQQVQYRQTGLHEARIKKEKILGELEQKHTVTIQQITDKNLELEKKQKEIIEKQSAENQTLIKQVEERDAEIMRLNQISDTSLQTFQGQIEEITKSHLQQIRQKEQEHDAKIDQIKQQFASDTAIDKHIASLEVGKLQATIDSLNQEHEKKLQQLTGNQERTVAEVAAHQATIKDLFAQLDEKNNFIKLQSQNVSQTAEEALKTKNLASQLSILQKQLSSSQTLVTEKTKNYEDLLDAFTKLEDETKRLKREQTFHQQQLDSINTQLDFEKKSNETKNTKIAELEAKIRELNKSKTALDLAKVQLEKKDREHAAEYQRLQSQLDSKDADHAAEYQKLQNQLDSKDANHIAEYKRLQKESEAKDAEHAAEYQSLESEFGTVSVANQQFLQKIESMKVSIETLEDQMDGMQQDFDNKLQFCMTNKLLYGTSVIMNVQNTIIKKKELIIDSSLLDELTSILSKFDATSKNSPGKLLYLFENQYVKKNVSGNSSTGASLVGNINGKILILASCLRNVIKQFNIMGLVKSLNVCGKNPLFESLEKFMNGSMQGRILNFAKKISDTLSMATFNDICAVYGFTGIGYSNKNLAQIAKDAQNNYEYADEDVYEDAPIVPTRPARPPSAAALSSPRRKSSVSSNIGQTTEYDVFNDIGDLDSYPTHTNRAYVNIIQSTFYQFINDLSKTGYSVKGYINPTRDMIPKLYDLIHNRLATIAKIKINHLIKTEASYLNAILSKIKITNKESNINPRSNYAAILVKKGLSELNLSELVIVALKFYKFLPAM